MKRPRRYSAGWLEDMGVKFSGSKEEALALFARMCLVGGDVFLCTDELRAKENRERSAHHGNVYPQTTDTTSVPLEHMFTPSYISNIEDHVRLRPEYEGFGGSFSWTQNSRLSFALQVSTRRAPTSPPTPKYSF